MRKQNWAQLLIAITEWFIAQDNPHLASLEGKSLSGGLMFFMKKEHEYLTSRELSNGKWICTNYNSQTLVKIIFNLCNHCRVDKKSVIITYAPLKKRHKHTTNYTSTLIPLITPPATTLTIKDAIIKILSNSKHPLTAEDIYNKIIKTE